MFHQFIKSLEREENKGLIEAILKGYGVVFEASIEKYNKFPLSALVKQAKKFEKFKDFSKFYSLDIYHGYYWHLTDNPNFKISGETGPRDMSSMSSGGISEKGALMITSDLEYWDAFYNEDNITRKYVVLLDASDINPTYLKQVSRGFGNEVYLNPIESNKLKIMGIYDIDNARKTEKHLESIIPQTEKELYEVWKFSVSNESLIENNQLSLFKEGDIKSSKKEMAIKKAKEIISESGDDSIEGILNSLEESDSVNELVIMALFKLKNIDFNLVEMIDGSKPLVYHDKEGKVKIVYDFTYLTGGPVNVEELITEKVGRSDVGDIVPKGREYLLELDEQFNKDFWESPPELYHGTSDENVEDIQKEGLTATSETRGMSNRSVGSAVFTSSEADTPSYYYDKVFKINTPVMKKDGYMPFVYQEPDVYEKTLAEALANLYGIENYYYEVEQGMDEDTIIFDGDIPVKYLELMD